METSDTDEKVAFDRYLNSEKKFPKGDVMIDLNAKTSSAGFLSTGLWG